MKKRLLYAAFLFACNTCEKEISPLRRRAKGFAIALCKPSRRIPIFVLDKYSINESIICFV